MARFSFNLTEIAQTVTAPLVIVGQRAIAGETALADLLSSEPPRNGEVR